MSATTGPSPDFRVCTWVSFTLNGASTLTTGAVVSVDPVTATLPILPACVHSGLPAFAGAAVGQLLASVAVLVTEGAAVGSATDVSVADGVSAFEPHAASVMAKTAAHATKPRERCTR